MLNSQLIGLEDKLELQLTGLLEQIDSLNETVIRLQEELDTLKEVIIKGMSVDNYTVHDSVSSQVISRFEKTTIPKCYYIYNLMSNSTLEISISLPSLYDLISPFYEIRLGLMIYKGTSFQGMENVLWHTYVVQGWNETMVYYIPLDSAGLYTINVIDMGMAIECVGNGNVTFTTSYKMTIRIINQGSYVPFFILEY